MNPGVKRAAGRSQWLALFLMLPTWPAAAAAVGEGEDWPRFLGPRADNTSLETGLLDRFPTNGPAILWEKAVGTGYSAPSVRGSWLVLHHRGRHEEVVSAANASTTSSWRTR